MAAAKRYEPAGWQSPGARHKKAPDLPGLLSRWKNWSRSVLRRDRRTTPIKPIDQFGRGRLFVEVIAIKRVSSGRYATNTKRTAALSIGPVAKVGETNLVLPEQTWDLRDGVFGAAPKEIPAHTSARHRESNSGAIRGKHIVYLFQIGLGVTTGKVSQQARKCDVADPTTNAPRPVIPD